jgi:hypothetical protein
MAADQEKTRQNMRLQGVWVIKVPFGAADGAYFRPHFLRTHFTHFRALQPEARHNVSDTLI